MGFYHPATLVKDAQRHGVTVLPIDVNASAVECVWEEKKNEKLPLKERPARAALAAGACRLGLRYVEGLRRATAESVVAARAAGGPFRDADDLARRARLRADELEKLAAIGALASLGLARREALWQASLAARPAGELFEHGNLPFPSREAFSSSPLPEMSRYEETVADFVGTGLTVREHPLAFWRERLTERGVVRAVEIAALRPQTRARIAGAVIVRQRPGTAKGTLFLTLEDESGMAQAIVPPALLHANRALILGNPGLVVEGIVEARDGSVSLRAERFWPLPVLVDGAEPPSHDFR